MNIVRSLLPRICTAVVLALVLPGTGGAQDVPPGAAWKTIETEHFRVTFTPELEGLARHAAARAEVARARLAEALGSPPAGRVEIIVTDHTDISNGFATPFPSNRIMLYAKPPVDHPALGYHHDWIDLVLTHELVHTFHFDRTNRVGGLVRKVVGRIPFPWPLFPVLFTPTWSTEGLATYYESHLTGTGRVFGTYHEMVVRTAILEDAFPGIDEADGLGPAWPAGSSRYIFGSLFLDFVAERYGEDALGAVVDKTTGAIIPPPLRFDRVARNAVGRTFTELWGEWRDTLRVRYGALADSLRAVGLTEGEPLTGAGRWVLHPRVAPGGGRVAFASADGRSDPATRLLDVGTGSVRSLARRNQSGGTLDPASWLPDGNGLVTSQFEFDGPYRLYQDLYRVGPDGREERLTRGARLAEPHVAPDGRRVVAVQNRPGTNRLVIFDLDTGALRPLTDARPDVYWALPRWSPQGDRIAVGRWRSGGDYDIVVLDTTGAVVHELARDRAMDAAPAWSPDGRYVLFSSDRSGIPNLYAYDLEPRTAATGGAAAPRLHQVTNVLGGAFSPDVSPDGRWIYYAGYHADGFHIERMPFDPSAWREPAPVRPLPELVDPEAAVRATADAAGGPVRAYSPLHSLLPRAWVPTVGPGVGTGASSFVVGGYTFGEDLVGRHAYNLFGAVEFGTGRLNASLDYRYAGLGNPVLGFGLAQGWSGSRGGGQGGFYRRLERERVASLSASLLRRRYRTAASLTAGGEWVSRHSWLEDAPNLRLRDPRDRFLGVFARAALGNSRIYPYSVSRENGVAAYASARRRWDLDPWTDADGTVVDDSYHEFAARISAYKGLPVFGFANHVLAARVAGLWRGGPGAPGTSVGGAPGLVQELGGISVGDSGGFLPVRGFDDGARTGTRAWSASVEYRVPLLLIGRGFNLWPVFLDRLSGALFLDAGDAWTPRCDAAADPGAGGCIDAPMLVGTGAEVSLDMALFFRLGFRLRAGVGYPLHGGDAGAGPVYYLRLGPSF